MGIKNTYKGLPEEVLTSFDWLDLATGIGYKVLYAVDALVPSGSSSSSLALTTNIFYGQIGKSDFTNIAGELNFDLEIEVPLTVEGVAIINCPVSSPHNLNLTLTWKIYRVTAIGTEKQLGSTVTFTSVSMLDNNARIMAVQIELPLTVLDEGEKLRLKVNNTNPGAAKTLRWSHDPGNRDLDLGASTFVSSQLTLNLPIKI